MKVTSRAAGMIKSFHHKGMRMLFETGNRRYVPAQVADRILRLLDAIHAAAVVHDLDLPGFGLHRLKGLRKQTWSLRVSGNYRLTFSFIDGEAFDVDSEDYH